MYIYFHYLFLMKIKISPIFCKSSDMKKKLKWNLLIYDMSPPNKYTMSTTMKFCVKFCESCEGECLSDVIEYCECCGVGKRNGCEMNPSDESIFDGMCDECREEDPDDDEECAECCNCGEDVSNDNGTGSLVGGEYWCKTCVEEK